jgi:hypothetical protein
VKAWPVHSSYRLIQSGSSTQWNELYIFEHAHAYFSIRFHDNSYWKDLASYPQLVFSRQIASISTLFAKSVYNIHLHFHNNVNLEPNSHSPDDLNWARSKALHLTDIFMMCYVTWNWSLWPSPLACDTINILSNWQPHKLQ